MDIFESINENSNKHIYEVDKGYFEFVKPTFIENWNKELYNMSIAQVGLKLSFYEMKVLHTYLNGEFSEGAVNYYPELKDSVKEIKNDLISRIDKYKSRFPYGFFVRLGSRSPKDGFDFYKTSGHCFNGKQALNTLGDSSERIYIDILEALQCNYNSYIWLRDWLNFEPWQEFRCFMYNKQLIGITQYNLLNHEIFAIVCI